MPEITIGKETLHYIRRGSGPTLVLVHSLGTASWLWEAQIDHWSKDFDVIAFDLRGHGKSSHEGEVTTRNIAADLLAALRELDAVPAHFIGISMGGPILARLHELDPGVFESLVIADSFATQGQAGHDRAKMLSDRIGAISMAEYGRIYADETILPATPRSAHGRLAESIGAIDKEAYLETVRSVFTEDVTSQLTSMRIPVLVVVGEKDNRTPPALSQAIADLVEGAELKVVPDAAHLANLDNPDGFHAAIDPFLKARIS